MEQSMVVLDNHTIKYIANIPYSKPTINHYLLLNVGVARPRHDFLDYSN